VFLPASILKFGDQRENKAALGCTCRHLSCVSRERGQPAGESPRLFFGPGHFAVERFYLGGEIGFLSSSVNEISAIPAGFSPLDANSEPLDGVAFRDSAFAGYNFQVTSRWLLGVEGDLGSANQTTTFEGLSFPFPAAVTSVFLAGDSIVAKTIWDASARGRVGFLVTPATLLYVTGGAAWQRFEVTSTCDVGNGRGCPGFPPAVITSAATKFGGTIGTGIETLVAGNWFARAEYRYTDFGPSGFTFNRGGSIDNFDVGLRTHTATFGVSYKFGGPGGLPSVN
jgi:outer membrane immunogenic protein